MENTETTAAAVVAATQAAETAAVSFMIFGHSVNLMVLSVFVLIFLILVLFWRIQRSQKLDFADLITKDGRTVSLTKVLQLVGGVTATWIMIKLTLTNGLTEALFGLYLAYVGGIEGYSKYVHAKYKYKETSVKDATSKSLQGVEDDYSEAEEDSIQRSSDDRVKRTY